MATGGINAVEPPYVVRVVNAHHLGQDVTELIAAISSAVEKRRLYEASRTGEDVMVYISSTVDRCGSNQQKKKARPFGLGSHSVAGSRCQCPGFGGIEVLI